MSEPKKKRNNNLPTGDGMAPHQNRGSIYDHLSEEQIALMKTLTPVQKERLKGELLSAARNQGRALRYLNSKVFREKASPEEIAALGNGKAVIPTKRAAIETLSMDAIREFAEISGKLIEGLTKTSKVLLALKDDSSENREGEEMVDYKAYLEKGIVKSKKKFTKKPLESEMEIIEAILQGKKID